MWTARGVQAPTGAAPDAPDRLDRDGDGIGCEAK
ncbi:hypothetical protein CLM62_06185 [Streptomyces sp. SA15]|nr:hypothetical protein CLM62_06185 [Streptomyces sp. SA15]